MFILTIIVLIIGFLVLGLWGLLWRGLIWLLQKRQIMPRTRILATSLVLGIIIGLVSIWVWPFGLVPLLNVIGKIVGDELYRVVLAYFGNPPAQQVSLVVPWLLRIPKIYALTSFLLFALAGTVTQIIVNTKRKTVTKRHEHGKTLH